MGMPSGLRVSKGPGYCGSQSLEGSDETLRLPESRKVRRDVVVPRVSKGLTRCCGSQSLEGSDEMRWKTWDISRFAGRDPRNA